MLIEATLAIVVLRALSCAVSINVAFAVAAVATLSKLPISVASSEEARARLVIASTFAMLVLRIPLPEASKLAALTLVVAPIAVLPRSALRLVTLKSIASVPVTPSAAIPVAAAPSALSCAELIDVARATPVEVLPSKLVISLAD